MKYVWQDVKGRIADVALYMSAWIEMSSKVENIFEFFVALYMSAWIEIRMARRKRSYS